jgi:NhaP-type Na+/H+ or K+/H+ antiporter
LFQRQQCPTLIPTPFSLCSGAAIGLIYQSGLTASGASSSIGAWAKINYEVVFTAFLPIIIFHSAASTDFHKVKRLWIDALLLAIVGTLYNAILITLVARYVFPYDWTWSQSALFGAILSAIDPVAVVNLMQSVSASEKLGTIIDGESMLNDGVAFVLFELFTDWVTGESMSAGRVVANAFRLSLGGPVIGLGFGIACTVWLYLLFDELWAEITITLVTSYSCWLVADDLAHTSGVLALVIAGGFLAAVGQYRVTRRIQPMYMSFWKILNDSANTLVFSLSGLLVAVNCWEYYPSILRPVDFGWTFVLWGLLLAIRASMILLFFPLLHNVGYGITWKDGILLSWAGLRGLLGLILSLAVFTGEEFGPLNYRVLVFFHMGLQAWMTLLIQGSSFQYVLKYLGYMDLKPTEHEAMIHAADALEMLGKEEEKKWKKNQGTDDDNNNDTGGGALLEEPDWPKVEELTRLDIKSIIGKRPVEKRELEDLENVDIIAEDLRTRFLSMIKAIYCEIFDHELINPTEYYALKESVEVGLDSCQYNLKDWVGLLHYLETKPKGIGHRTWGMLNIHVPGFRRAMRSVGLKGTERDCVLVVSFIHAHRAARDVLRDFVVEEEGDLEAGGGGGGGVSDIYMQNHGTGIGAMIEIGASKQQRRQQILGTCESTKMHLPYNHLARTSRTPGNKSSVCTDEKKNSKEQQERNDQNGNLKKGDYISSSLSETYSKLKAALEEGLERIKEESEKEEKEANAYLKWLIQETPCCGREVTTAQAAINVLRGKGEFIDKMEKAGVLEERESSRIRCQLQKRLKKMHLLYSLE